ncbi:hypothetical protein [Bradyrhizobium sp. CCBAU 53421]|uniref:hypothetical protein n=1 Tax=unclassified Bradyrhizobium TaxID=2631580 RepID=UPI00188AFB48|nr:hypothetical protein [Bradyrhizobium sp. CCBAU 53421]
MNKRSAAVERAPRRALLLASKRVKSSIDTGDKLAANRRRHLRETIAKNLETCHGLLDLGAGCAFS